MSETLRYLLIICLILCFTKMPVSNSYYVTQSSLDGILIKGEKVHDKKYPFIELRVSPDNHSVSFTALHVAEFEFLDYSLTYDTDVKTEGVKGVIPCHSENSVTKENIVLGTCSKDGCLYHSSIHNLLLRVKLVKKNGDAVILIVNGVMN